MGRMSRAYKRIETPELQGGCIGEKHKAAGKIAHQRIHTDVKGLYANLL
jgi:hypothetical protein